MTNENAGHVAETKQIGWSRVTNEVLNTKVQTKNQMEPDN